MNSNRGGVDSTSLNSGLVQSFRFNSPYTAAQNAFNSAEAAVQAAVSAINRSNSDLAAARIARDKAKAANANAKTAQKVKFNML
jgi:hypothetical protein